MLVYEKVIWNEEYYFNNELFFSHISYSHIDRLYKNVMNFWKDMGKNRLIQLNLSRADSYVSDQNFPLFGGVRL